MPASLHNAVCPGSEHAVPADPLRELLSPQVLADLKSPTSPSDALAYRISVIESDTTPPASPSERECLRWRQAQRVAWNSYLSAAFACRLFDGDAGADLRSRLTGRGDDNFRSAMAECMACCFLSRRLNLSVSPRPRGKGAHQLEFMVNTPDGDISVEVKSPHREEPNDISVGDDADMLARCLRDANRQFARGQKNLLLLVPQLRTPVYGCRHQLVRAFLGEHKFTMLLNAQTGERIRDVELEFFPEGKFLETKLASGKQIKPDGSPPFTRVSAVLCVEEALVGQGIGAGPLRIECKALVLHNPCADRPIAPRVFGDCVQLDYATAKWTDGRGLYP